MSSSARPEVERISIGLEAIRTFEVDETVLARHVGGRGVLATPAMVAMMERASNEAMIDLLPPGHVSVGYEVHVFHLAPAPFGSTVEVRVAVDQIEGRKVRFAFECRLGEVVVGKGHHTRAVVAVPPA